MIQQSTVGAIDLSNDDQQVRFSHIQTLRKFNINRTDNPTLQPHCIRSDDLSRTPWGSINAAAVASTRPLRYRRGHCRIDAATAVSRSPLRAAASSRSSLRQAQGRGLTNLRPWFGNSRNMIRPWFGNSRSMARPFQKHSAARAKASKKCSKNFRKSIFKHF